MNLANLSDLGFVVRERRKAQGITQEQLAAAIGSYPRAIINMELARSASFELAVNALRYLGASLQTVEAPVD